MADLDDIKDGKDFRTTISDVHYLTGVSYGRFRRY